MNVLAETIPTGAEDLLARASGGDRAAFTELVERHHPELVRMAFAVTGDIDAARDAAQVAWIKAWQRLPSMPTTGRAYELPSLDSTIAEGLSANLGQTVLGKGSHDAVPGDVAVHSYTVKRDRTGAGVAFLQCIGPSSATVTWPSGTLTSACVSPGGDSGDVNSDGPMTVEATGDTSWRVVIYSP